LPLAIPPRESAGEFYQSAPVLNPLLFGKRATATLIDHDSGVTLGVGPEQAARFRRDRMGGRILTHPPDARFRSEILFGQKLRGCGGLFHDKCFPDLSTIHDQHLVWCF